MFAKPNRNQTKGYRENRFRGMYHRCQRQEQSQPGEMLHPIVHRLTASMPSARSFPTVTVISLGTQTSSPPSDPTSPILMQNL